MPVDWIRILLSRCAALSRRRTLDADLDEELRAHIELATEENMQKGMPRSPARIAALRAFGGLTQTRETYRTQRGFPLLQQLGRDLSFSLRQLRRAPGFTLAAILTLALAIGANTAIFSVLNALLLQHLAYPQPERIGTIFRLVQGADPYEGRHSIDGDAWAQLRDNVPSLLSAVSNGQADGVNLQAGSHVEYVHAGRISAHYLDVLGLHPFLGHNFSEEEDTPHGPRTAILSFSLWRNTFAEDRGLVGRTIHLKGDSYTVIGILARDATTPLNADVYTAIQPSANGEGGGSNYEVIARLRDGATWQQADAEINRAWRSWAEELQKQYAPGAAVSFRSVPLQKAQTATLRPQALTAMFAAGFILLIACANLAGLTLVRMSRRTPEIAIRLALGASRWRVQRQLWVENLALAIIGGGAGIGIGFLALRGLLSLLPVGYLPVAGVPLDGVVLAFTLAVSVLTSLLFGMLPALVVRKVNIRSAMATRSLANPERLRLRQALIAGEVALTVVLLASAGLLIRTLIHLESLPAGFNPDGVMAAKASVDDARYHDPAAFHKLLDESIAAMERIPGVEHAAVALSLPYERVLNDSLTLGDGREAGQQVQADVLYATPGYFATLQIPLLAGRAFTAADGPGTQRVAIVNQAFVRKFYHGKNPVGRTLQSGHSSKPVIVGVVTDVPLASGLNPIAPLESEETYYIPAAQMNDANDLALLHTWFQPGWIVRTNGPIEGLTGQMQRALASVDPSLPFSGFYSMSDLEKKTLAAERVEVALLGSIAGLALLLSTLGIFALVATSVAQRTREIGIRIALGATVGQAMRSNAGVGIRATGAGLAIGLLGCLAALRVMRSVLYGVSVYDAPSLLAVVGILAGISVLATTLPTLRIAKIDPATTLRDE